MINFYRKNCLHTTDWDCRYIKVPSKQKQLTQWNNLRTTKFIRKALFVARFRIAARTMINHRMLSCSTRNCWSISSHGVKALDGCYYRGKTWTGMFAARLDSSSLASDTFFSLPVSSLVRWFIDSSFVRSLWHPECNFSRIMESMESCLSASRLNYRNRSIAKCNRNKRLKTSRGLRGRRHV